MRIYCQNICYICVSAQQQRLASCDCRQLGSYSTVLLQPSPHSQCSLGSELCKHHWTALPLASTQMCVCIALLLIAADAMMLAMA
jgi:hypothetical protein